MIATILVLFIIIASLSFIVYIVDEKNSKNYCGLYHKKLEEPDVFCSENPDCRNCPYRIRKV